MLIITIWKGVYRQYSYFVLKKPVKFGRRFLGFFYAKIYAWYKLKQETLYNNGRVMLITFIV